MSGICNQQPRYIARRGFTLIELSIVLVIIGLIIGGVLVGNDLIKAALIRKIGSEHESLITAAHTFKLKYNALPGDMPNPGDYFPLTHWGNVCLGDPPGSIDIPEPDATCGGNGNGILDETPEIFPSHLRFANLSPLAVYVPSADANTYKNYLTSSYPKASFYASYRSNGVGSTGLWFDQFNTPAGNHFYLSYGRFNGVGLAPVTSDDALLIDRKFDDGDWSTGRIQSSSGEGITCRVTTGLGHCDMVFVDRL